MPTTNPLRDIRKFTDLVRYLEAELEWPVEAGSFDDLTFEYQPAELGLKTEDAVKIKKIHQLRPLVSGQPWGIFFVEFEKKKLPVVVLRCILSHLVVKKRASANKADLAAWNPEDLLFISAFGDEDGAEREIAFAHFHQQAGDLPTLNVLGWDGSDTPLKLDYVAGELREKLHWPKNPKDHAAWRAQWRAPFRHRLGHVIRTADSLAEVLAALARGIRDRCQIKMRAESEHGALTKLYQGFQTALIHDLKPEDFADTYAQTITYGLLTAAISRTEMSAGTAGTFVRADDISEIVPVTNPFLKEMLQMFLKVGGRKGGIDFDELGIQDVVELLRGEETDLPAILRDFGNKTRGEDPVIHFYEHFLAAYNKKLKIQRGVFYTPQPVVSYIVRSVHELLQTEFGLADGLASTVTWGEMVAWGGRDEAQTLPEKGKLESPHVVSYKLKIPEGVKPKEMFVQILDPATGTATFLVEVIDVIHLTLKAKWDKGGLKAMPKLPPTSFPRQPADFGGYWNHYVPLALLPRLHGYELMMAPYAIAHMKIGLKLHETGYRFGTEERARIYLTNALEPKVTQLPQIGFEALAHEAAAVNEIKWYKRFTVVVGNPPYAGHSSNKGPWVGQLLRDYYQIDGVPLDENNTKWLQDDYVKFIRLSQHLLLDSKCGILGFITNHGFLENPTFRGMRKSLINEFCELRFLDLHGNSKKKERSPDKSTDDNVFEIQQGVSITLAVAGVGKHVLKHAHLYGSREVKYKLLQSESASQTFWNEIEVVCPMYLFKPQDRGRHDEYSQYLAINDIMPVHSLGVVTARDALCIHFTKEEMWQTIEDFSSMKPELARKHYALGADARDWQVVMAQGDLRRSGLKKECLRRILYRPFDWRWTYYTGNSRGFHCMPRGEVMRHMIASPNIGLSTNRSIEVGEFTHVACANTIIGHHCVSLKEVNYLFPLWLFPDEDEFETERRPNLSQAVLRQLGKISEPEDILNFFYAIFHSPTYRSRYAEFLKIDFPRLPLTGNLELFRALARLGGELTALHLLEFETERGERSDAVPEATLKRPEGRAPGRYAELTEFIGGRSPVMEKVSWANNTVWLDKALTTGFKGVREEVWNFHIGGYQVCEKWLKDRKGRTLTKEDLAHYQKIIVALAETIRLMKAIDEVIEKNGGWPLK